MSLPALSIRRPVGVIMIVSLIVFMGMVSLFNTPTDLLPEMAMPVVAVVTSYSGAGAREVESLVTRPIEQAMGYVGGVESISSESSEGTSVVTAQFIWGTNLDSAVLDIRDSIDLIRTMLPDGASAPRVIKADLAMMPVVRMALAGPYTPVELTRMAEKVRSRLERIEGVASTSLSGGIYQEALLEVDPSRLLAYGLTIPQIASALRTENLSLPGGQIDEAGKSLVLRTQGEFTSLADIGGVGLTTGAGGAIRVADLGTLRLVETEAESITRVDGHPAVTLSIRKQSGTNTVVISREVRQALTELDDVLEPGASIQIVEDQADFINRALDQVSQTIVIGGLLAVLVLYLFLIEIKTVAVIALAMPVSILATFAFMYFAGLTLNLVTMGGLALGIGMLVDNAIVIIESIYRHRSLGSDPYTAAAVGTHEVANAVTASTLTTVVVFVPVVFVQGLASQVFSPLSLVVTLALGSSLLVSMTFVPMAAASLLPTEFAPHGRIAAASQRVQARVTALYRLWSDRALNRRRFVMGGVGVLVLAAALAFTVLPQRLMPPLDQRELQVTVRLGQGTALGQTDAVMTEVEQIVMQRDDVEYVFLAAGGSGSRAFMTSDSDTGSVLVKLIPQGWRMPSTEQVAVELRRQLAAVPGAEIAVSAATGFIGEDSVFGAPLVVSFRGDDLDTLASIADYAAALLQDVSGLVNVETTLVQAAPEIQIVVDRQRAAQFGVGSAYVATVVRAAVDGQVPTSFRLGEDDVDVRLIYTPASRASLTDIANLLILTPTGKLVRVGEIATLARAAGPTTIRRLDGARIAEVQADLTGITLDAGEAKARSVLAGINLPAGYTIEYGGETQEISDTFGSLSSALIMGVLLVYMVMAAQFESMLQPLIIMITLPLALAGAVVGLMLIAQPLTIASVVGLIALVGVVVNNGIVLIDYANQLRASGMDARAAILEAGAVRLRPILMTSLTTISALLPMVLVRGDGNEMLASLSAPLLGGLTTSTLLTLFVVPVLYASVADVRAKIDARRAARTAKEA